MPRRRELSSSTGVGRTQQGQIMFAESILGAGRCVLSMDP